MRTKKSLLNTTVNLLGQVLVFAMALVSRSQLSQLMPKEYLGINGLFSNVLTILSLAELGIGTAMMYALYAPVAAGDRTEIQKLMNLYRRMYRAVAAAVAVMGLALVPFLPVFIRTDAPVSHLTLIYLMYLAQSVSSYFFVYKTAVIEAHQNQYIYHIYVCVFTLLRYLMQIIVLFLTQNFLLYLAVQIACTLLPNFLASRRAERMYPYIRDNLQIYPERETKREILKNTKALFLHKIGGTMVYHVDYLLMSALAGLGSVGVYSNYKLIVSNVNALVERIFDGISASIGNLAATEKDEDRLYQIYCMLNFGAFLLYSFCSVEMLVLFSPFLRLFFGEEFLFPPATAVLILAQFYISGMRVVTQKFRNVMGIFWHDRYKALVEVVVNLSLSLLLAGRFGLNGILAGTVIDLLLIPFWVDPVVLFRYGWKTKRHMRTAQYFIRYAAWTGGMALAGFAAVRVCALAPASGFGGVVRKGAACAAVYGALVAALFGWTADCRRLASYVLKSMKSVRQREGK